MSPETWSKYSPSTETTTTAAKQESANNDGVDDQPTTTTSENKPVEDGDNPGYKPEEEDRSKPGDKCTEDLEDGDKVSE